MGGREYTADASTIFGNPGDGILVSPSIDSPSLYTLFSDLQGGSFSLGNVGVGSSAGSEACGGAGTEGQKDSMVFSLDGKPRTVKLLQESMYLTDMDLTRFGRKLIGVLFLEERKVNCGWVGVHTEKGLEN